MVTDERKARLLDQILETIGGDPEDYIGNTLEDALVEIESFGGNIRVYWDCWTEAELQEILYLSLCSRALSIRYSPSLLALGLQYFRLLEVTQ